MPRFRASRWVAVVVMVIGFPIASALIFSRENPGAGAIVGLITGVLCGLLVLAHHGGSDSRYFAIGQLRPNAIVLQCRRDPSSGWGPLDPLVLRSAALDRHGSFALSFERDAMTLWGGGATPEVLHVVPYAQIGDIGVGERFFEPGFVGRGHSRLRITLLADGTEHEVQFGVEEDFDLANEARLAFLAQELRDVLEGVVVIEPDSGAGRRLNSGMTAWSARQFATVGAVLAVGLSLFLVPVGMVFNGVIAAFLYATSGILVVGAIVMVLMSIRVARRELSMGYTTLDRAHLEVEQRHPVTGAVIRAAGRPALTSEELRAALARKAG